MTRSRDTGTRAETAVARYAAGLGIPAHRTALTGGDVGDVHLWHGRVVVQVKAGRAAETASWGRLAGWWADTEAQAARVVACDMAVLVVKRAGCGQPGDWWAWHRVDELLGLTHGVQVDERQVVGQPLRRLLARLVEVMS